MKRKFKLLLWKVLKFAFKVHYAVMIMQRSWIRPLEIKYAGKSSDYSQVVTLSFEMIKGHLVRCNFWFRVETNFTFLCTLFDPSTLLRMCAVICILGTILLHPVCTMVMKIPIMILPTFITISIQTFVSTWTWIIFGETASLIFL